MFDALLFVFIVFRCFASMVRVWVVSACAVAAIVFSLVVGGASFGGVQLVGRVYRSCIGLAVREASVHWAPVGLAS